MELMMMIIVSDILFGYLSSGLINQIIFLGPFNEIIQTIAIKVVFSNLQEVFGFYFNNDFVICVFIDRINILHIKASIEVILRNHFNVPLRIFYIGQNFTIKYHFKFATRVP